MLLMIVGDESEQEIPAPLPLASFAAMVLFTMVGDEEDIQ